MRFGINRHPALLLALAVVVAACQASQVPSATPSGVPGPTAPLPTPTFEPTATPTPEPTATPTLTPTPTASTSATPGQTATPKPLPSATGTTACAQRTLAGLTMDQRIGQLFSLAIQGTSVDSAEAQAITLGHIGNVWLQNNRTNGVAGVRPLANSIQALANSSTGGVRFFVAADQEGGYVQRLAGPGFSTIPTALSQGSLPAATLQANAQTWGGQLRAAGVNMNFAPVMDVVPPGTDASNAPIGQLEREYGHDPSTVGVQGSAVVKGMMKTGVVPTLKHFPGLGRVVGNTDFTGGVVDTVTTMNDPYLQSFIAGMRAGAPVVMVSLATYTQIDPDHLAVFSPTVITTLLRGQIKYTGIIASDDMGLAKAVASFSPGDRAISFISAGGDLIVVEGPATAESMVDAVRSLAASDATFRAKVNAAALLILRVKAAYGLVSCG